MVNSKIQKGIFTPNMFSHRLPKSSSGLQPSRVSLKALLIVLVFILPVGIILATIDTEVMIPMNEELLTVQQTNELEKEQIEIESMCDATSKTFDNDNKLIIPKLDSRSSSRETEVLQPGPNSGKDASISTSFGQYNTEEMNWGADPDIWLTHNVQSVSGFFPFRGLFEFDINSLYLPQHTQIINANLRLYYFHSMGVSQNEEGVSTQMTITAHPLTRDWVEGTGTWTSMTYDGVCWNKYDGLNPWSSSGGDYTTSYSGVGTTPTSYGWTSIDVTAIVEAWVSGSLHNHGLILKGDYNHEYLKEFRSSDFNTASQRPKLEIDYISNLPPVINKFVSPIQLTEDQPDKYIYLDGRNNPTTGVFTDPDVGDTLSFYVWTGTKWAGKYEGGYDSELMTASIMINGTLVINLKPNQYGNENIIINATDSGSASMEYEVTVNVQSVNDQPVINETTNWIYDKPEPTIAPGILTCLEDQWVNFTVTAWDPAERNDDHKLTFSANTTNNYASFFKIDPKTGRVTMLPKNSDVGSYFLQLTVNDGQDDGVFRFTLVINNVNDKPVFERIETDTELEKIPIGSTNFMLSKPAIEDTEFHFIIHVNDEDLDLPDSDEELKISISPEDKFIFKIYSIYPKKIYVTFIPDNEDVGIVTVQVKLTDQANAGSIINLMINVTNVNDPPEFKRFRYKTTEKLIKSDILDLEKHGKGYFAIEHESYVFRIEAEDPDPNDALDFEINIVGRDEFSEQLIYKLDDITGKLNTKQITLIPDHKAGREEELWINITATDLLLASNCIHIRIPVINTNDPPEQSIINIEIIDADQKTNELENLTVTFRAEYPPGIIHKDPDIEDENELSYIWDFGDGSDPQKGLDWIIHKYPKSGTYTVTLTIRDPKGATNVSTREIEVLEPAMVGGGSSEFIFGVGLVSFSLILVIIFTIIIIIVVVNEFMIKKHKKRVNQELLKKVVTIKPRTISKPVVISSGQVLRVPIDFRVPGPPTYISNTGNMQQNMQSGVYTPEPVHIKLPRTQQNVIKPKLAQLPPVRIHVPKPVHIKTQKAKPKPKIDKTRQAPKLVTPNLQSNTPTQNQRNPQNEDKK